MLSFNPNQNFKNNILNYYGVDESTFLKAQEAFRNDVASNIVNSVQRFYYLIDIFRNDNRESKFKDLLDE